MTDPTTDRHIQAIERPDKALWTYYLLSALVIPPLFPLIAPYLWFRYSTMRYKFTDDGISMSWGILFRREIIVNYARIQDIHLRSNFVERWLGLARVLVQTASGNAGAELTATLRAVASELRAIRLALESRPPSRPPPADV